MPQHRQIIHGTVQCAKSGGLKDLKGLLSVNHLRVIGVQSQGSRPEYAGGKLHHRLSFPFDHRSAGKVRLFFLCRSTRLFCLGL